ncbi:MAG: hypothetical protein IPN22_09275 [Bacteroidetes bacterium]|nr:hypothetical protein [Bacteroidota bacterium]
MEPAETHIQQKAQWVYGISMLIFLYRFMSEGMFTQMSQPVLASSESEWIYTWFLSTGIASFIVSHTWASILFDLSLFALPILLVLYFNRWLAICFTALTLVYFLSFNVIAMHHYHGLIGVLLLSIPFWFTSSTKFTLAWDGVRYYFLYIFASAAIWKLMRGSVFNPEQMSWILKGQQLDYLLQHPTGIRTEILSYLIVNTAVSHLLLLANTLLQLSFIIGFFTKRYDKLLLYAAVLFSIANYIVMGIASFELLILCLTLFDWSKMKPSSIE